MGKASTQGLWGQLLVWQLCVSAGPVLPLSADFSIFPSFEEEFFVERK